jgi:hypothetical protein
VGEAVHQVAEVGREDRPRRDGRRALFERGDLGREPRRGCGRAPNMPFQRGYFGREPRRDPFGDRLDQRGPAGEVARHRAGGDPRPRVDGAVAQPATTLARQHLQRHVDQLQAASVVERRHRRQPG